MMRPLTPIALGLALLSANVAQAQDRPIGFLTPSKNIACQFFTDNGQGVLRCDIMNMDARPRRPADCELDWGHAFEMSAKGAAGAHLRRRHGDGPVAAGSGLWRGAAAQGICVPVGADGTDVLQRDAAGVFSLARGKREMF